MPSGTIKHCKCTEPESRQTVSFFLFIFFRWAGSNVQYTTKSWGGAWEWGYKTAAFYTEQHVHWLIAFSNIEVSQSGSNRSQKHGFKCDAIFFTCTHGHKAAIITQLIVLKAQIDNFIWWEVSQEMYISYYADTTTTLAWFTKYSRFNIRQCSQQQLFLICIVYFSCWNRRPNYVWSARVGELLSTLLTGAHNTACHYQLVCRACPCTRHGIQYCLCMCTFSLVTWKLHKNMPRYTYD